MSSNAFCHCHPAPSGPSAPVAPDYKEKMVAVSAILNPETVAINTYASAEVKKANKKLKTETKVILFQSLYNGTVGYDQVSFEPHDKLHSRQKGDVVGFYGEKGVPTLKFRSTLTSVLVNNLVRTPHTIDSLVSSETDHQRAGRCTRTASSATTVSGS